MKRLTREQKAKRLKEEKADRAEHNDYRRKINTHFLFWTECEHRACGRARGCAGGDPDDCFKRWWPVVPEELKVEFRACVTGMGAKGMSYEEAVVYAQAEVARWKEDEARWAKSAEEQKATVVTRKVMSEPLSAPVPAPRVRSL